jgi:hypothetical protein
LFDRVTVEISAAEAADGALRAVAVPPGDHTITVQLPPGVADGTLIRLAGAGRPDPTGGPARDLVLDVRVLAAAGEPVPAPEPGAPPAGDTPDPAGADAPTTAAGAAGAAGAAAAADPASTPPFPTSGPPEGYPATGPYPPGSFPDSGYPDSGYPTSPYQPGAYPTGPYPGQPYPGQPAAAQPYPGQPDPGQPYPGQPYPGQPYPDQPYPGQPYPGQPYPGQPYPGQPQPGQPVSGQPFATQQFPAGPYGGPPPYPVATPPKRGRGRLIAGVAAATVLVLLLGCCGLGALLRDNDDQTATPAGGDGDPPSTATAAPEAEPASAQEYQAALTAADSRLTQAFTQLAAARTPKSAQDAAAAIATAADTGNSELAAITPPEPVAGAHQALLTALTDLSAAASETQSAAGDRQVCTGGAATALISRSPAVAALRAAGQQLATADPGQAYSIGGKLPKEIADTARRAKNGSYVKRTRGGSGQLKIDNGGRVDSAVSLVRSGTSKPAITVYVRGSSKFTVTGVRDGTYTVYMSSGQDWDPRARKFTRNCGFSKFDDTMKFTTTSRQYTIWSVTLNPVAGGNASTSGVDPDQFPEG